MDMDIELDIGMEGEGEGDEERVREGVCLLIRNITEGVSLGDLSGLGKGVSVVRCSSGGGFLHE